MPEPDFTFACQPDNDLYHALAQGGRVYPRYDTPAEAVAAAPAGSAALLLADGYPAETTPFNRQIAAQLAQRRLRVYLEYPAWLPEHRVASPRRAGLERAVVTSDALGPSLPAMSILAIHDCHFIEVQAGAIHLALARVAGFDRAVYGTADVPNHPFLFEAGEGLLVCTGKLSQFITARYAPPAALATVWRMIFAWLAPGAEPSPPDLRWIPTVRPAYGRAEPLPPDAEQQAAIRGVDWHTQARMLIHPSWAERYEGLRAEGQIDPLNPVGPPIPADWPAGDGELGILEGVASRIAVDGSQGVRWWQRTDSVGESALAFALRARLDGDARSARIAANLLDWVYERSGLWSDDPVQGSYGLVRWAPDNDACYGDNCIKVILGCLGTSALLGTHRWDRKLVRHILANFRTTGPAGFRPNSIKARELDRLGWQHYWRLADPPRIAPHYQAWIWSAYLWLYDKTRDPILLERTRAAIRTTMAAYPAGWRWTNGIQQERGRMLLTLAWLIRVDDRPEHRGWLRALAEDMRRSQDVSGAIAEELGALDMGSYHPPLSNAEYGTNEAALIQANGDPVADLLYTCNFSFLGLHEAHAATGEALYREMEDRLAQFLVRVQARSEARPELDGAWFRAFDFRQWEYWGSNADAGWGAWSIEVGWTQGWVSSVLALRELGLTLWDISRDSGVAQHWAAARGEMLGE